MSNPKYCCEVEPEGMPDLVARKEAHWVGVYSPNCSECGCDAPSFLSGSEWKTCKTKYCPNCGSFMKPEKIDKDKVITAFEAYVKNFRPACTTDEADLEMLKATLLIAKDAMKKEGDMG